MERKGCDVSSFATVPDTDIEKIRECDEVSFTKKITENFYLNFIMLK